MYLRAVAKLFEKVHHCMCGFFNCVILLDFQYKNEVAWVLIKDGKVPLTIRCQLIRELVEHFCDRQNVTKLLLGFLNYFDYIVELSETGKRGHSFNLILYAEQRGFGDYSERSLRSDK